MRRPTLPISAFLQGTPFIPFIQNRFNRLKETILDTKGKTVISKFTNIRLQYTRREHPEATPVYLKLLVMWR